MNNATTSASASALTIRPQEAAHFGALAAEWWDAKGSSAMLHRLNPVRLRFIREAIDAHFATEASTLKPLNGRRALDVGCGAGLLAEPLARLGGQVTGIDAAAENIAVAQAHASAMGLAHVPEHASAAGAVRYLHGEIGAIAPTGFDLVCAMEVIEHVAHKEAFVAALAQALTPDGLLVLSTPNRTSRSRLLLVEAAERFGQVPRGTHHWDDFITPDELAPLLAAQGLTMRAPRGISWSPVKGLHLSDDLALNYIVTATRS